jgi:condensin complex subunit 3
VAEIRVELNQLKEELNECINNQDFSKAAELKAKIPELQSEKDSFLESAQPSSQEVRVTKVLTQVMALCFILLQPCLFPE